VCKILKQNKFHPYNIYLVQKLNEDDFDQCLEFCELMMEKIEPDFFNNSFNFFFYEATFHLIFNRHNCRFWLDTDHWML